MTGPSIQQHLEQWEKVHATRSWGRYPPEELVRFIGRTFKDVDDRAAVRVMEVGCGAGANIWFLAREGFSVAGIDGSRAAIEKTGQRLGEEGLSAEPPRIDLRQGNFAALPWDDGAFDVVIDIEALYANPMDVIHSSVSEIHRVLAPQGVFFGKMFGAKTSGYQTGELLEDGTSINPTEGPCGGFGYCHFFTEEVLRGLFDAFSTFDLDSVHRTDRRRTVDVFEWLVTAKK